jgi:hypothetical protein
MLRATCHLAALLALAAPVGALTAGCVGEAPAVVPDSPDPDPPTAPPGYRISGKVYDYFVPATALGNVSVATEGLTPGLVAVSQPDGSYALNDVPTGSKLFLAASRPTYKGTRNVAISVGTAALTQDLYVLSAADVARQYTSGGRTPTAGRAFVVAELQRNNGTPLDAVPLADVQLVDAAGAPVAGLVGPYVLGADSNVILTATATQSLGGKSRVAFLDVPAGSHTLKVTYPGGQGQPQTVTTTVVAGQDGATVVTSRGQSMGGGQGAVANPRFATDIFPRLQTAANGGLGCANCHTVGGAGAVLVLNALAADVHATLIAKAGLIDTAAPAQSQLLTKPLYEAPPALQDHPNATFLDANDADYKLILRWIQQGALL